jgi:hypothetical protein
LVVKHGGDPLKALAALKSMAALGTVVGPEVYSDFESEARKRPGVRDPEDWPILATALALPCPIWTEDLDFFGCGLATWTSASIESFCWDQAILPDRMDESNCGVCRAENGFRATLKAGSAQHGCRPRVV